MKATHHQLLLLLCGALLFTACGEEPTPVAPVQEQNETEPTALTPEQQARLQRVENIVYTLPSPFETLTLLKESGVPFSDHFLHSTDQLTTYSKPIDKAIILGVYGADLSYASVFEQDQPSLKYLAAVNRLTTDLGIGNAFSPNIMDRVMTNRSNPDSVQTIVSEAYAKANNMLKENGEEHIAAIVLAGGWIEGLYIATRLAEESPQNIELVATITDQKFALENLLELLKTFKGHLAVSEMTQQLETLYALFERSTSESATTVEEMEQDGKTRTVIGGGLNAELSAEQVSEIAAQIENIRTLYVDTASLAN